VNYKFLESKYTVCKINLLNYVIVLVNLSCLLLPCRVKQLQSYSIKLCVLLNRATQAEVKASAYNYP